MEKIALMLGKDNMKIAISNIIWKKGKENFEEFLTILNNNEIDNIELALNCIFEEPTTITHHEINWLKSILKKYNITISALHSLTYTREDLEFFSNKKKRQELLEYVLKYIDLAKELKVKNIVYGSPKSRKMNGYSMEEANLIFLEFLKEIDKYSSGINFNIEPLPITYCEYLNTFDEGVNLIKNADLKNIFIQLDVRSIIESEENIDNIFKNHSFIKHVHIGEPSLTMPSIKYKDIHKKINCNLNKMKYNKYIAIEVLNHQDVSSNYIFETINSTRKFYNDKA